MGSQVTFALVIFLIRLIYFYIFGLFLPLQCHFIICLFVFFSWPVGFYVFCFKFDEPLMIVEKGIGKNGKPLNYKGSTFDTTQKG